MVITAVSILIIMAAYFLLLYGAVGFIQDKRFFSSAPKENLDAIPDTKEERFRGAHIAGWCIVNRGYCMEIYDIVFFDWFLLCNSNFFAHFYPEVKGKVGPAQFGYNKKTHIMHFVIYIPASAILAWLCTLI